MSDALRHLLLFWALSEQVRQVCPWWNLPALEQAIERDIALERQWLAQFVRKAGRR